MENDLRAENAALRCRLDELIAEARRNEEKLARCDRFERRLIGSRSLHETLHLILDDYRSDFDLDAVTLALVIDSGELAPMFDAGDGIGPASRSLLRFDAGMALTALCRGGTDPVLGAYEAARHGLLFAAAEGPIASVALLPLVARGQLIGSLNLGSRDAARFAPGRGTELLARLAALVAACLDSAANQERIKLMGLTDPLTGLGNRRYFERRCEEEIVSARRHASPLACMFLDIDRFKRINDTLGHPAGDEVLRRVAAIVRSEMRGSDVLARFGGEEFVVLLPQTGLRQAMDIAERVRRAIGSRPIESAALPALEVTVSIGLAALPAALPGEGAGEAAGALIAAADRALYRAKQAGRNRVLCELSAPRARATRLTRGRELLRRALSGCSRLRWAQRRC
jgi:diguanylate cyclase (GGDEF)-like protein